MVPFFVSNVSVFCKTFIITFTLLSYFVSFTKFIFIKSGMFLVIVSVDHIVLYIVWICIGIFIWLSTYIRIFIRSVSHDLKLRTWKWILHSLELVKWYGSQSNKRFIFSTLLYTLSRIVYIIHKFYIWKLRLNILVKIRSPFLRIIPLFLNFTLKVRSLKSSS